MRTVQSTVKLSSLWYLRLAHPVEMQLCRGERICVTHLWIVLPEMGKSSRYCKRAELEE